MEDKRDTLLGSLLREGAERLVDVPRGAAGAEPPVGAAGSRARGASDAAPEQGSPRLAISRARGPSAPWGYRLKALGAIAAALAVLVLTPLALKEAARLRDLSRANAELAAALFPERTPLLDDGAYAEALGDLALLEAMLESLRVEDGGSGAPGLADQAPLPEGI